MMFELKLAGDEAELQKIIAMLSPTQVSITSSFNASQIEVPAKEDTPKRHRRTKAEIEAARLLEAKAAEYEAEAEAANTPSEPVEEETEILDFDEPSEDEFAGMGEPEEEEPAPLPAKKPAPAPKAGATKAAAKPQFTHEQLIKAFQAYARKHSADKARAVLNKYGLKNVRDIPEDKRGEIIKQLGV